MVDSQQQQQAAAAATAAVTAALSVLLRPVCVTAAAAASTALSSSTMAAAAAAGAAVAATVQLAVCYLQQYLCFLSPALYLSLHFSRLGQNGAFRAVQALCVCRVQWVFGGCVVVVV